MEISSIGVVEEDIQVVKDDLACFIEKYCLVPFKYFCVKLENRTEIYREIDIIRHVNTTQILGWAVCKHVTTGSAWLEKVRNGTLQKLEAPKVIKISKCIKKLVSMTAMPLFKLHWIVGNEQ